MNLLPIEPISDNSSSAGNFYIKCAKCYEENPEDKVSFRTLIDSHKNHRRQLTWNGAAKHGWTWDQQGKPYESYYCKECTDALLAENNKNCH